MFKRAFVRMLAALRRLTRYGLRGEPEPLREPLYECRPCGTRSHRLAPCTYCGKVMRSVEGKGVKP